MADEPTSEQMTAEPSPEERANFERQKEQLDKLIVALDKLHRKRKIMLIGYLSAAAELVLGQLFALYVYGSAPPGVFVGYVFFIPFIFVGFSLWFFGRLARKVT
jgi:hypothetical protein